MGSTRERSRGSVAFEEAIEVEGLTLREVEEELELERDTGTVTRLRNGERKPGRELSYRIFKRFGVSMELWEEVAAAVEKGAA